MTGPASRVKSSLSEAVHMKRASQANFLRSTPSTPARWISSLLYACLRITHLPVEIQTLTGRLASSPVPPRPLDGPPSHLVRSGLVGKVETNPLPVLGPAHPILRCQATWPASFRAYDIAARRDSPLSRGSVWNFKLRACCRQCAARSGRIDTPSLCDYAEQWLLGLHLMLYAPLRVARAARGI